MKSTTKTSIEMFIHQGIVPGDFLQAVMTNNLRAAVLLADDQNKQDLSDIFLYIRDRAPMQAWGTEEKIWAWAEAGGLDGIRRMEVA